MSLWCRFNCVCFPLLRDVTVTLPNQEAVIVYFLKMGFSRKLSETFFNSAVSKPLIVVSKLLHIPSYQGFLKNKGFTYYC